MANLLALIQSLGPKALALINYLIANKDQITQVVDLLITLFNISVPKTAAAVSDDHFINVCKSVGASTGDAQELLAALSK